MTGASCYVCGAGPADQCGAANEARAAECPRANPRVPRLRGWWVEFDNDGRPVCWRGDAASQAAAERLARLELGLNAAARLVVCLER